MDGLERVLAIFCIMSGGDIQVLVAYVRRNHLQISVLPLNLTQELLEAVAQSSTFRKPQRKTCADILGECEKFHLLAEFAMVALLGFLHECVVFVEHLLLGEADTIHTHKLMPRSVAAPVSTGKRSNLNGLYRCRIRQMRATAKVCECALCVCCYIAVFQFAYKLALIFLSPFAEHFQRIGF